MKNTITTLLLTVTLSACANFELGDHVNPVADPHVVSANPYLADLQAQVEADQKQKKNDEYVIADLSTASDLPEPIMEIPELGLGVYELDPDSAFDTTHTDTLIDVSNIEEIDETADFWQELFFQEEAVVGFVGGAPENILSLAKAKGHKRITLVEANEQIYESELVVGIIEAGTMQADCVYVPIVKEDASTVLISAVLYSQDMGIKVFDKKGEEF